MRRIVVIGIICVHLMLVAGAEYLPDAFAPAVAATVYLPLLPLAAVGIPVFGHAESGGWPGPSYLGWLLLSFFWVIIGWLVAALIVRVRS